MWLVGIRRVPDELKWTSVELLFSRRSSGNSCFKWSDNINSYQLIRSGITTIQCRSLRVFLRLLHFHYLRDFVNGRRRRVPSDWDWSRDDVLVRSGVEEWSSRDHIERSGKKDDTILCCLHWRSAFGRWRSQEPSCQEPANSVFGNLPAFFFFLFWETLNLLKIKKSHANLKAHNYWDLLLFLL